MGLAAILAVSLFLYAVGFYPVAAVNGQVVLAKDLRAALKFAEETEERFRTTYGGEIRSMEERKNEVWQTFIEDILVRRELASLIKPEVLNPLLAEKISAVESAEFELAAETLYGATAEAAREFVVLPQAERDILRGRFLLQGADFEEWLKNAKQDARVVTFLNIQ